VTRRLNLPARMTFLAKSTYFCLASLKAMLQWNECKWLNALVAICLENILFACGVFHTQDERHSYAPSKMNMCWGIN
jgi:hypothetical protein